MCSCCYRGTSSCLCLHSALTVSGVIRSSGPDLLCVLVASAELHPVYVYNERWLCVASLDRVVLICYVYLLLPRNFILFMFTMGADYACLFSCLGTCPVGIPLYYWFSGIIVVFDDYYFITLVILQLCNFSYLHLYFAYFVVSLCFV
jgi:hypothetical protein